MRRAAFGHAPARLAELSQLVHWSTSIGINSEMFFSLRTSKLQHPRAPGHPLRVHAHLSKAKCSTDFESTEMHDWLQSDWIYCDWISPRFYTDKRRIRNYQGKKEW